MYLLLWLSDWMSATWNRSDVGEPLIYEDLNVEQVEEWLLSYGLIPLEVVVCPNECGCVTLKACGQPVAWMGWTSDLVAAE